MEIRTTDLYLTAYLISNNVSPQAVISQGQHKKKIIFIFPNSGKTSELLETFSQGKAMANILDFRSKLEYVRDQMFAKLREY